MLNDRVRNTFFPRTMAYSMNIDGLAYPCYIVDEMSTQASVLSGYAQFGVAGKKRPYDE